VLLGPGAASWAVLASDGVTALPAQLLPASPADAALRTDYYGVPSANMSWLAFAPPPLPAVGYSLVFLVPVAAESDAPSTSGSIVTAIPAYAPTTLRLGSVVLGFDGSGLLANYSVDGGLHTPLQQNFLYYASSLGDKTSLQASWPSRGECASLRASE
jgi:hypothetical protein